MSDPQKLLPCRSSRQPTSLRSPPMGSDSHTHTPGPWRVGDDRNMHANRVWTHDMRPIANLCSMGTSPADVDPEAQANARLIAASPCMKEALASAFEWFEANRIEISKIGPGTIPTWVTDACAALSKAGGQSK